MKNCLFCKMVQGNIPIREVYQDDQILAFHDIDPQAPTHILVIPKKHIESVAMLQNEDAELLAHLFLVLQKLAQEFALQDGFRIVTNIGKNGGQTVPHLHFHLLGGRPLSWPPG